MGNGNTSEPALATTDVLAAVAAANSRSKAQTVAVQYPQQAEGLAKGRSCAEQRVCIVSLEDCLQPKTEQKRVLEAGWQGPPHFRDGGPWSAESSSDLLRRDFDATLARYELNHDRGGALGAGGTAVDKASRQVGSTEKSPGSLQMLRACTSCRVSAIPVEELTHQPEFLMNYSTSGDDNNSQGEQPSYSRDLRWQEAAQTQHGFAGRSVSLCGGAAAGDRAVVADPPLFCTPYLVDSNHTVDCPGLGFRSSPNVDDLDEEDRGVPWGSVIEGTAVGDDWVKVGDLYLPMKLRDETVLHTYTSGVL